MSNEEALLKEVQFKAVLSGGPGGQHANKASTKVILTWNLEDSQLFSVEEKIRLSKKLKNRLIGGQSLQLASDHSRSQHKNKEIVIKRFLKLIDEGLKVPKKRKKTLPSKQAKLKRLKAKKLQAEKKEYRKKPKY